MILEVFTSMFSGLKFLLSVIIAFLIRTFGGYDDVLHILIILMCVDYGTGIMKAYLTQKVNSQKGFKGIVKKVFILCIVVVATQIDMITKSDNTIRNICIISFCLNECISILENATICGLPVPQKLKDVLEQLKNKG